MSWHLGYPLSQTLFTSFYVEALSMPDPRSIQEATFIRGGGHDPNEQLMLQVLRAYCLGMLKSCGYVNERIKSEHYYEVSVYALVLMVILLLSLVSGGRLCHQHI
jgi:hypothetical protein